MEKKLLIISLFFILTSGFAQKKKYDVVNDFLEIEFSKIQVDTIYLIDVPLPTVETLKLYEKGYAERMLSDKEYKEFWVLPPIIEWPLDAEEIEILQKSLKKEQYDDAWKLSDFQNKKLYLTHEGIVRSSNFIINNVPCSCRVINLSKPFYNMAGNYAFFQFSSSFLTGGAASNNNGLIIMHKKDNRWVKFAVIQPVMY